MATTESPAAVAAQNNAAGGPGSVLVCLGAAFQDCGVERIGTLLSTLEGSLAGRLDRGIAVAYPSSGVEQTSIGHGRLQVLTYRPAAPQGLITVQPAGTWLSAFELMRAQGAAACLLLGAEAESLSPDAMQLMVQAVVSGRVDLAVPRYSFPSDQGLLNAAIISPLSRALYGVRVRFPLALDFAVSYRMAEKLAASAQRFTSANQSNAIVWPVAEAANAGFELAEVHAGIRELPQVNEDLSDILNNVVTSLFSDVEQRAAFWQRSRPARELPAPEGAAHVREMQSPVSAEEIDGLLESYRNGFRNLHEIWSLVLPPNSLVALKRLSVASHESFSMPDPLWARIVYDFVLAHRLRTLNRSHLMGVMVPLYLGWVASHIIGVQSGRDGDPEPLARAFEADKPYLVSRWRWPDRFNP